MTKTEQALALMRENPSMTAYAAAKAVGMSQSVLTRAIKARNDKTKKRCPVCGHVLRDKS